MTTTTGLLNCPLLLFLDTDFSVERLFRIYIGKTTATRTSLFIHDDFCNIAPCSYVIVLGMVKVYIVNEFLFDGTLCENASIMNTHIATSLYMLIHNKHHRHIIKIAYNLSKTFRNKKSSSNTDCHTERAILKVEADRYFCKCSGPANVTTD